MGSEGTRDDDLRREHDGRGEVDEHVRLLIPSTVLGFFVIAGSMFSQQVTPLVPDAIFYNGKILTVDSQDTIREAFATQGETFVAVGTNAQILSLAAKTTKKIDLHGYAVIPGLMDE